VWKSRNGGLKPSPGACAVIDGAACLASQIDLLISVRDVWIDFRVVLVVLFCDFRLVREPLHE